MEERARAERARLAGAGRRERDLAARHQHAAERCPAKDPSLGAMLLNHLSRPNVRRYGLEIKGEAVVQGGHTLFMIVESPDERSVNEFMEPFMPRQRDE